MLQRPFLTPVVVAFWCVTTAWLLTAKILPTWRPGAPPDQLAVFATANGIAPVAWTVFCNDRPVGWALTRIGPGSGSGAIVDSRLHFERLPWDDLLPGWTTAFVSRLELSDAAASFDAHGRLAIDPDGRLRSLMSVVQLPGAAEPLVLSGTVHEGRADITVSMGESRYQTSRRLPAGAPIGDELSPLATLPGLYPGRRWTVPVFSPLRSAGSPLEILHAEVGDEETLFWEDELVRVHVVDYRAEPSGGDEPRSRLWVDRSGRVLRQEAILLGATFAFVRRTDHAAERLAAHADDQPGPEAASGAWAELVEP